jgi:tRNA(Ile)-lysidine synthase
MLESFHTPEGAPASILHVLQPVAAMLASQQVRPGEHMLVAVSGGADSVCLFDALRLLGLRVEVLHLDHQTRSGQSAEDAAFVATLAEAAGVPWHATALPVAADAERSGQNFEAYARQVRYSFFLRVAREKKIRLVATGHTADDQAETVLMRFLRGTSPRGLGGILPVRNVDDVLIVRPLLACTRTEVLRYMEARDLAYREDVTNADTAYLRNRIRHELLPTLRESYNPSVNEALLRLADVQRAENALLETLTEIFLGECVGADASIDRTVFCNGHRALQRRAIVHLLFARGVEPQFERVEAAIDHIVCGKTGCAVDVGGGLALRLSRSTASFEDTQTNVIPETVMLNAPGEAQCGPWHVRAALLPGMPAEPLHDYCTATRQVFDATAVGPMLILRSRRRGDRITPLGMTGTQKLKDWLIDHGIPRHERDALLVVEGKDGIVWIPGGPVSRHAAVTPSTRDVLEIQVTSVPS